jgi:ectoine hydroxylase-related dioxygenase (phytanoyl-CoA dioxygenase family)
LPRGKKRFDLEPGHCAETPRLRRIANPVDISAAYRRTLWESRLVDAVADLVTGPAPGVKFHHCKLNIKMPEMATYVGWHQDHPFDPHTNDSIVVALVMLDDMDEVNGCIRVVPGSHRTHFTHYDGDRFTGHISDEMRSQFDTTSVPVGGKAGDVCLIDTWMVHGSEANRSERPRRMLICDYTASDAFPLTQLSVPTENTGRVIWGQGTRIARFREGHVELPPVYEQDSFFSVQGQGAVGEKAAA